MSLEQREQLYSRTHLPVKPRSPRPIKTQLFQTLFNSIKFRVKDKHISLLLAAAPSTLPDLSAPQSQLSDAAAAQFSL